MKQTENKQLLQRFTKRIMQLHEDKMKLNHGMKSMLKLDKHLKRLEGSNKQSNT